MIVSLTNFPQWFLMELVYVALRFAPMVNTQ